MVCKALLCQSLGPVLPSVIMSARTSLYAPGRARRSSSPRCVASAAPPSPLSGFYFREARFLRTFRIEINGEAPWLAEAALDGARSACDFTYVHPEITQPGGGGTGPGRRRGGH